LIFLNKSYSASGSRFELGSSRINNPASEILMNARARAIRCIWPPEGEIKSSLMGGLVRPREFVMRLSSSSTGRPSFVSRLLGRVRMKSVRPLVEIADKRASSS
jgi:hypothetical protein